MRDRRLIHDAAWAMTRDLLRLIGPLLTDGQKVELFPAVNCEIAEGLGRFVLKRDRERQRLCQSGLDDQCLGERGERDDPK